MNHSINPSENIDQLKKELLSIHQDFIKAHLEKNIEFMVENIAPDYYSVSNGEIRHPTKDQIRNQFNNYLNNTEFSAYTDLAPPIIKLSVDGSMAWMMINMNVAGKRTLDDGSFNEFDHIWAWIEIYYREGEKWIRQGEVSCARENPN